MRRSLWGVLAVVALLVPGYAGAQVAWDSPMLMPPGAPPGFGLYLMDMDGGGLGVMGHWRSPSWNFGVRGGLADESGPDDDLSVFGGIDFDGGLTRASDEFPLDVDWVLGAGLAVGGNGARISVPLGLSTGHSFTGDGVTFTPFVTPRIVFDAFFDDDDDEGNDGDNTDLELAIDLGLDLRFSPNFTVRFGATLGDREAVAIGLVF